MTLLNRLLPFLLLAVLIGILYTELFIAKQNELPSALVGHTVPDFALPQLTDPNANFTTKDLRGHVSLLNIWASWCYACDKEQALLSHISSTYHIPIYGINYKDDSKAAKAWLKEYGNPYIKIGADQSGDVAIDLGIYGTPETFVIDPKGVVLYRHVGVITEETWEKILHPLIKKYEASM